MDVDQGLYEIGRHLRNRSFRYFQGGMNDSKCPEYEYVEAARAIYKLSQELAAKWQGGGNHSVKTWFAILAGPDVENLLMAIDMNGEREEEVDLTTLGKRKILL